MKKARVTLSVILALVLALSAVIAVPVTASAESSEGFTLKLASNFFPEAERTYADISKFEDDNGDVYVTAMFKLYADQKYIVNVDIDELTWDPDVLAWDESYNQDDVFGQLNLFPFAVESGSGTGIIHKTADGRIVGNYSNATQPAFAYTEDGTAATVVKAVFKVLDTSAAETTVTCNIDSLSLCDETEATEGKAYVQYKPIENKRIFQSDYALAEYSSEILPKKSYFKNMHSVTPDGNICVNFYLDITDEEAENAVVDFSWFNKTTSDVPKMSGYGYRVTCPVAAAEMTYPITATIRINEVTQPGKDVYAVVDYARTTIESANSGTKLKNLVKAMLDYGSKAQLRFNRNVDNLANGGTDYFDYEVTADSISGEASDMDADLANYGLEYTGSSVVYLDATKLRHYYKITEPTLFDQVKDGITLDGAPVEYKTSGKEIYYEVSNIAAPDVAEQHVLKIGTNEYRYSVLNYAKKQLQNANASAASKELSRAVYRYYKAADAYYN